MKRHIIKFTLNTFLLGLLGTGLCQAESAKDAWISLTGKKPSTSSLTYVTNNPALPNILIYGDSISLGYTNRVRELLDGKANVYRLHCNGGDSGTFITKMTKLHQVMGDEKLDAPWNFEWDVIHFNVGLHDLKHLRDGKYDKVNGQPVSSIEQYKKNLHDIVAYLKSTFPNADVIFATTTPVPEGADGRIEGDAQKYNEAALEVLSNYPTIRINDLYALTKPHHSKWWIRKGDVHYNREGKTAQGDEVARLILEEISGQTLSNQSWPSN